MDTDTVVGALIVLIAGPILLMGLYVIFVMCPVMMYTEAQCLRNGYPKYAVTVGLERYCTNLAGTVTIKVEKVSK